MVKIHYNIPQIKQELISANIEVNVWGRGTGKTEGLMAPKFIKVATSMPRGATVILGSTYMQLLDRTLPPLYKAWAKLGYRKDVHYFVRKKPDPSLGIPEALYAPDTSEHCIYWYNGHIMKLVSQDRPGTSNGMSVDFVGADEAKLLNKDKFFEELSPTNRGNEELFGHLSDHHGIILCTDMPTTSSAAWIFEFETQCSQDEIHLILALQFEYDQLKIQYENAAALIEEHNRKSDPVLRRLKKDLHELEFELYSIRKEAVSYLEASIMDNIDYVTPGFIRRQRKTLPPHVFDTALMNKRTYRVANGFYPTFDIDRVGYDAYDYNYIESLGLYLPEGVTSDCRKDADLDADQPLQIAMDYGGTFNCMAVGQEDSMSMNVLSSFYSVTPKLTKDVVKQFNEYYKHHKTRRVIYYYDQTAIGDDGKIDENYADQVIAALRDGKWEVESIYLGSVTNQAARFKLFEAVYAEKDKRYKSIRINRGNNKYLVISLEQAGTYEDGKGKTKKDKRPEKKKGLDQRMTTHLSDAHDTLYIGSQLTRIGTDQGDFGVTY